VSRFDYAFTIPAAFAQVELVPAAWLSLSASARVDAHSEYGTFVNPRVSALFRAPSEAGERWTARASIGTGVFTPTPFTEETEVTGLTPLLPLAGVDVERATTASLDVGGPVGPLEVNATVFGSIVRDPLAALDVPPATSGDIMRLRLVNATEPTRTAGSELLARYVAEPWHVTASYTFIRATEHDPDAGARRTTPLVPRHAVGLVGMYEQEGRGRMGLELYYTGRQALEHNPYRATSLPYLILGALVERQVGPARLFINFENLTDVRQTRTDPLVLPARGRGGRWTTDAWTELGGRTINGGVRLAL
jgi:iron complex outermembrane receptor protein